MRQALSRAAGPAWGWGAQQRSSLQKQSTWRRASTEQTPCPASISHAAAAWHLHRFCAQNKHFFSGHDGLIQPKHRYRRRKQVDKSVMGL